MTGRAALILAGGSAKRFQTQTQPWQDKALVELDGKPLLVHTVLNVQGVADEVAVCVNSRERQDRYGQVLQKFDVNAKFVVDEENSPIQGPLLAIMSGLKAASASYCLTVPVDMPYLKPEVAEFMFKAAEGYDVAVPMWPDGTLETLLMALERKSSLEIADALLTANKPRADSIPRGASKLHLVSPLKEIKTLDPELKSFINLNAPHDLTRMETRNTLGKVRENLSFKRGVLLVSKLYLLREAQKLMSETKFSEAQSMLADCADSFEMQSAHFWAGVSAEKLAEVTLKSAFEQSASKVKEALLRGAKNYRVEAEIYAMKGCRLLSERALADADWCQSQIKA